MFIFSHTATTQLYTLSLHDALPISGSASSRVFASGDYHAGGKPWRRCARGAVGRPRIKGFDAGARQDRKSTRLNSSHPSISYAVFCLKKKNFHPLSLL